MRGAGAAKTGLSWIREGTEEEEEEEEGGDESLAEMRVGRNVGLEREVLEGEKDERKHVLREAVDDIIIIIIISVEMEMEKGME
ncbi:uncharacterized protein G2W53_025035 [Senna tora]|uniref:Uncharacterized protein n=1 Tax=Senna tora TaxID=362788 RepID=A0A834TEH9_9FABA|nr:uncharacterized protein G2W53_025035 [Senna tora]